MDQITVPGSVPGLLRLGSVVLIQIGGGEAPGVVVRIGDSPVAIVSVDGFTLTEARPEELSLDLTDATGRAHAAWYLGGVGASWHLSCDGHRRWEIHGGETPRAGVMLAYEGVGAEHRRMGGRPDYDVTDVPALDSLIPDDPRLLPDGSRWVDAEALRLVVLHVAGVVS